MTHVLIPDYPIRVQFSVGATASAGPFAFSFTFFALNDIHVWVGGTELTYGTQFTVAGNPGSEGGYQGGSVTLTAAVANATVTVMRVLPLERVSDFPDAGSFNRRTLNTTLDKHVAMIQQVDERVDRALTTPPGGPPIGLVGNNYLKVDALATGIVTVPPLQVRTEIQAQPLDATLTGLAALTTAADQLPYSSGVDSFALATFTAYARSIMDDIDAVAARATLGLGTMATQNSNNVNITGGSISGVAIAVPGLGTMSTQNANAVAITGGTITGIPTPTNFSDVATKSYADNLAFGVNKRSTVRLASTANIALATFGNGALLDGIAVATFDRVLVKDQTLPAENGVYLVGPSSTLQRAADFDTYDECPGSLITIQEGTVNNDTVWLCTSNSGGTLGTTAIDFSKVKVSPTIPVIIAEGGTGQTTALAAFNALKQPASSSYVGAIQLATQAEVDAGVDTLKAIVPATLATRLAAASICSDCRFDYISSTVCRLGRWNGNQLTINGVAQTIPIAGVDLAVGGLAASTPYQIYAYMNAGVMTLEASATAYVFGNATGMMIKSGDATRTLVGRVFTQAGPTFVMSEIFRGVTSWFNRRKVRLGLNFSQSTASTTPVALMTALTWADWGLEAAVVNWSGVFQTNLAAAWLYNNLYFNFVDSGYQTSTYATVTGGNYNCGIAGMFPVTAAAAQSVHVSGYVGAGTGTWNGFLSVEVAI